MSDTYQDGLLFFCPECAHEWPTSTQVQNETDDDPMVVQDSNGTPLTDGDSITVIKDLKVKGSSAVVKVGTRVKNVRLAEGDHKIDCKIDGIGAIKLKSQFVKKA